MTFDKLLIKTSFLRSILLTYVYIQYLHIYIYVFIHLYIYILVYLHIDHMHNFVYYNTVKNRFLSDELIYHTTFLYWILGSYKLNWKGLTKIDGIQKPLFWNLRLYDARILSINSFNCKLVQGHRETAKALEQKRNMRPCAKEVSRKIEDLRINHGD